MTKQEQFFYEHAGYSVAAGETKEQGKERTAKHLATAETWALQEGYTFIEDYEKDADLSWMTSDERREPHECIWIQMRDEAGACVASLCGITDATEAYKRVIRAELASEAMYSITHG